MKKRSIIAVRRFSPLIIIMFLLSGCGPGFYPDYKTVKPNPCCSADQFEGNYSGHKYTASTIGPYYWGDKLELVLDRTLISDSEDSWCLRVTSRGILSVFRRVSNNEFEKVTEWRLEAQCSEYSKPASKLIPFKFTLSDFTSNEVRIAGDGKLLIMGSLGSNQVELSFEEEGGRIVQIQLKKN